MLIIDYIAQTGSWAVSLNGLTICEIYQAYLSQFAQKAQTTSHVTKTGSLVIYRKRSLIE